MDLEVALRESIERICGIPADEVQDSATLDDLGIDSLTAAELITDLEIRMGQDLPMDVLRQLNQVRTVGEVADQLRLAISAEPPRPSA